MNTLNLYPAMTSFQMYTHDDSSKFILYKNKENSLKITCTINGITLRALNNVQNDLSYVGTYFTLFHRYDDMTTTIVRRYIVEYDPEKEVSIPDEDNIELEIPIDDDFSQIDFVYNYYYLIVSFTFKHPGEMGNEESIFRGNLLETKIPFIVNDEVI